MFEMGNNEISIDLMHTFVFTISRLPRHLERLFSTIFNTPEQAKIRKSNIFSLGSKLVDGCTKESLCIT